VRVKNRGETGKTGTTGTPIIEKLTTNSIWRKLNFTALQFWNTMG
jgi:hypothetical protein